jgi:hypothetical protein
MISLVLFLAYIGCGIFTKGTENFLLRHCDIKLMNNLSSRVFLKCALSKGSPTLAVSNTGSEPESFFFQLE